MSSGSFAAVVTNTDQNGSNTGSRIDKYAAKKRELETSIKSVKKARVFHLTKEQKLDIAHTFYFRKLDVLQQNAKHPDRKPKAADAQKFTAHHLGYSSKTVAEVTKAYKDTSSVSDSVNAGNHYRKQTRVPKANGIIISVRNFVRNRRKHLQRTVAKDVLAHLVDSGYVVVDSNNRKDSSTALRGVQRFLNQQGYRRGKKKGGFAIREKEALINKRNKYLDELIINRKKPPSEQMREVYLDESYIHHHYKRTDESIYDPSDEQDLVVRELHKGQRYCFAAAIQGPDPRNRSAPSSAPSSATSSTPSSAASGAAGTPAVDPSKLAGIVPNTKWIFEGKNSVKDYHSTFNSHTFLNWFTSQLLVNLHQPSLIIMDNASYHKTPKADAPRFDKMKIAELRSYLHNHNVEYPATAHRPELVNLCNTKFPDELLPATVRAAEEKGHKVIFTPPYHSDVQPIELVWAHIKGEVGRKYVQGISFQNVLVNLNTAFNNMAQRQDTITLYIQKSYECALKFTNDGVVDEDDGVDDEDELNQGSGGGSDGGMSDEDSDDSDDDEDDGVDEDDSDSDNESFASDSDTDRRVQYAFHAVYNITNGFLKE